MPQPYTIPRDEFDKRVQERLTDLNQFYWISGPIHFEKYQQDPQFREQINAAVKLELYQNHPEYVEELRQRYKRSGIIPYDFKKLKPRGIPDSLIQKINDLEIVNTVTKSSNESSNESNISTSNDITGSGKIVLDTTPITSTDVAVPNSIADFAPANVSKMTEYVIKTVKNPQIPYGDLNSILNGNHSASQQLRQLYTMDDVVMHVNRPGHKAAIKLYNFDTQNVVEFPTFILRSFNLHMEQKSQVYETFDSTIIYLFGDKPILAEFVLSLYDMKNADWFRSFYKQYVDKFAAYSAASKRLVTYIVVDDILFEGVMLRFIPKKDLESNEIVHAGLTMLLTGMEFLSQINEFDKSALRPVSNALNPVQVDRRIVQAAHEAVAKSKERTAEERMVLSATAAIAAASGVGLSVLHNDSLRAALKSAQETVSKSVVAMNSNDTQPRVYASSWVSTGLSGKVFGGVGQSISVGNNTVVSKIAGISTKIGTA